ANAGNARTERGGGVSHGRESPLQRLPRLAGPIRRVEPASLRARACHGADQNCGQFDLLAADVRPIEAIAWFAGREVVAAHVVTVAGPSDIARTLPPDPRAGRVTPRLSHDARRSGRREP